MGKYMRADSRYSKTFLRLCSIATTVLLVLNEGKQVTVKNCGENFLVAQDRILGGGYVNKGEYPWIVSLQEKNDTEFVHLCGGTILNDRWIITAAHCIDHANDTSQYEVYAGLDHLSKKEHDTVKRHKISRIIIHEDYDTEKFVNDIALLETSKPIGIDESIGYINGICLPETKRDPYGWAIVAGWGRTIEGGEISNVLKSVKVPIVHRDVCRKAYNDDDEIEVEKISNTSMICAGIINRDSCQNDSGGPLIQRNKKGSYTLIGVVSWGEGCGRRTHPGVYTKVASFVDWIENNV